MTLEGYLAKGKTDPQDYENCVIHESQWPEILTWGMRNGYANSRAFARKNGLFGKGSYNMIRLYADGAVFACEGKTTVDAMVREAAQHFGGIKGPGDPLLLDPDSVVGGANQFPPLFLDPYKLGILPKPPPPVELEF